MGHLINPTALRIGWKKTWLDNIYTEHLEYPQLLHKVLRIRFFINCFLIKPYIKAATFLYSHIIINHSNRGLVIQIYYYDGKLEASWYRLLDMLYLTRLDQKHWSGKGRGLKDPTQRLNYDDSRNFFIFLLLYSWYNNKNQITPAAWNKRQQLFQKELQQNSGKAIFSEKVYDKANIRFFLFLFLIKQFILLSSKENPKAITKPTVGVDYEIVAKRLFFLGYSLVISNSFFELLSLYINSIIFLYWDQLDTKIDFFVITNNQVTANFLAKYIAGRIGQGYNIKSLINPLRRELQIVRKQARTQASNMLDSIGVVTDTSWLLKKKLKQLIVGHNKQSYLFFCSKNSLMNFEQLVLLRKLMELEASHRVGFSQVHFNKQALIMLFLKCINSYQNSLYVFKANIKSNLLIDNYYFYRELSANLADNYINLSESAITSNPTFSVYKAGNLLSISMQCLTQYLQFTYLKNKWSGELELFNINKEALRSNKPELTGLRGFKFQFRGRFTRKQIAAAYCFVEGSVPLNTLKANIDYAFTTVAIKNSAIGVKVWLYKEGEQDNYFLKVTN